MNPSAAISRLLVLPILLSASGCETADHVPTSAERVLGSQTGKTVVSIAGGKDPIGSSFEKAIISLTASAH